MRHWHVVALLGLGIAFLLGSLLLRVRSGNKYEVKSTDLVFIIMPLVLVALATGKLRGIDLFGVRADFSDLWTEEAQARIEQEVSTAPPSPVSDVVQMMEMAPKMGVREIPRLIAKRTEALEFRLGQGGYSGPAIEEYFTKLYGSSYLRYVVVDNPDGTFFGLYVASDLLAYLRTVGPAGYSEFQGSLNRADAQARKALAELPGFVSASEAVTPSVSKREALAAMDKGGWEALPVVDEVRRFRGTVERSKLTTSLILGVTEKLKVGG